MRWLDWLSLLSVALLTACATAPEAPPVVVPEAEKPISSVEPVVPAVAAAPKPAPKVLHPKPKRKDKAVERLVAEKATAEKVQTEKAAPEAKSNIETPEPARVDRPIKGPAWLARCAAKRFEGGVILCDADSLLVQPSALVKIYTREPALAGKVASGVIVFRAKLPHRYRLFAVP